MNELPLDEIVTPAYVCDLNLLRKNLELLKFVQDESDCRILLALKGFAMFAAAPMIREYLVGTCASSVHEAQLGKEEFQGQVHAYAPAYSKRDIEELIPFIDHINFNSFGQYQKWKPLMDDSGKNILYGLRINPEYSEIDVPLYDPCRKNSRLGITLGEFKNQDIRGISGLHFHTLCEQNTSTLENTLAVIEKNFGEILNQMKWVNFGGGHHITRSDYDVDLLIRLIRDFKQKFNVDVYLEPGEAVALNTGYLVASVLDILPKETPIAILDISATAHMPDVLEMPYRPEVEGAGEENDLPFNYQLGGLSCLAGDEIGTYSFSDKLEIGQKLVFKDMIHYTMVKNTTFNGVRLPSIVTYESGDVNVVRDFGYESYKGRLS